ncbi:MAG: 3-methyl-2-oxobutanoate hydroxymethyltransferase [Planctomycetaceae bacterium]|nr:3-methyl-2-oxobutanoate hydroxymethyltransferase [Planctomycetaceae bacterium]
MKLTPPKIKNYKKEQRKIVMLTAYDYPTARILDAAGIDILLVGDSMGNVVQGKKTTLPVTVEQIIYHAEMVARAADSALVVADLPFPFCQLGAADAVQAAARIIKETLVDAVKIEGGEKRAKTIEALTDAGIPVMGHCGLLPQDIHQTGGFFIQRQREQLLKDVAAVQAAGAFAVVLECVGKTIAAEATAALDIPTIGIGSGADCDGQVLVIHDVLGFTPEEQAIPKHAKRYADLHSMIFEAAKQYADDVRGMHFPVKELNEKAEPQS